MWCADLVLAVPLCVSQAPELVRSMPYGHQCDLWSVGVICYELFVGQPPFFTNSFYTLVHLIVDTPVNYPASMSPEFKSFLEGLLHKTPSKRLSWPELQNHPFVRETEEEQRARNEIAMQGANTGMQIPSAPPTAGQGRHGTPRLQGHPTGLGGAALPPATAASKPNTAANAAAASALPPTHSQPAAAAAAATKSASQPTRAAPAASAAASAKSTAGASTPEGGTRSRSGSTELDLRQLPHLLSPAAAAMLPNTLQELTALLQRASASSQLPSPLLDIYPTLLSEHVPAQLCRLLVSTAGGSHAPALDLSATLSCVLPALVAMLQPSGGPVAPMPLYTADSPTADGSANGAGGATGNRASVRAAVGRAPPNLELQLRRQMAESVCQPPEGSASRTSAFDLLSQATRAACKADSAALSNRGDPSPLLSNLVIMLFQCTRSCVAPSAAAAAALSAAASSAPSTPAPSTTLLDALSKDVGLISALLSTLSLCASGLSPGEVSARARLAGRLLLFFASLCGKTPAVVKMLVQSCAFDCSTVLAMLSSPATMVALPASFLLSQLLTNPYAKLESAVSHPLPLLESIARLLQLPAMSPSHPTPLLVELEGSGVGYSIFGSHDGLLQLLQALLYFHALQAAKQPQKALIGPEALKQSERFLTTTIWNMIMARLEKLEAHAAAAGSSVGTDVHASAELSVLGWMSLLSIVLELLKMTAHSSSSGSSVSLLSDSLFRGMCALLSASRVAALYAWPEACGGGSVGVGLLLKRALSILYVPFTAASASSRALTPAQLDSQEQQLARAQKVLFNCGFVRRLLSASRLLELPAQLEAPLGFLVHLTIRNANFEKQMLDSGGLQLLAHKQLLNPSPRSTMVLSAAGGGGGGVVKVTVTPSPVLLTDALLIVSHVARSSAANYPAIHAANLLADLKSLLAHSDAGVRAKTANVLGNLCRHSAFFYPHLRAAGILPGLVACTSDADANVRKWAAFALGNAVFYDSSLCADVVAAIPALLRLLSAKDDPLSGGADRTAQNAAGVLNNMLRHGVAAQELIELGAVETLVQLLTEATTEGEAITAGKPPSATQVRCARSALFTLGELAAFRSARQRLQQHGLLDRIQAVHRSTQDPKLQSYYQRFVTRMQAPQAQA